MRHRRAGQSLVEFALVGPVVLVMLLLILDFGRAVFFYTEMAAAAREGARQAALSYNQFSNTLQPFGCTAPCEVSGVMPQMRQLASFGLSMVYADSSSTSSPPWYAGGYSPNPDPGLPGTLTLAGGASANTAYVFIYQLDPQTGTALWPCSCSSPIRTGLHQRTVVDVKMKFQPVTLSVFGVGSAVNLDAQSVQRLEWQ